MSSIPYSKVIPLVELGPGATVTILNPWLLPSPKPIPAAMLRPKERPGDEDARMDALELELDRRMREQLAALVIDWQGVVGTSGEALPLPKDDADVYDRCPQVVKRKLRQAIEAMELDMEWDPTRRRTPPAPKPDEKPENPDLTPENDSAEN